MDALHPIRRGLEHVSMSPKLLRRLLWAALDNLEPFRYRWLQEHPHRDAIMGELVDIALEFARLELAATHGRLEQLDNDELHLVNDMIAGDVLDVIDLWDSIHHDWARQPPTALDPDGDVDDEDPEEVEKWVLDLFCDYLDHHRNHQI